jgi:hypothetical protein
MCLDTSLLPQIFVANHFKHHEDALSFNGGKFLNYAAKQHKSEINPINCLPFVIRRPFQPKGSFSQLVVEFHYLPDTLLCLPVISDLIILNRCFLGNKAIFSIRSYEQLLNNS